MEFSWPEAILKSFEIIEKVGEGSFGYVYKAKKQTGSYVAIKIIKPTCSTNRTLKELQILHKVENHRAVIKMLACHRHLDKTFIFFPFIDSEKFSNVYRSFTLKDTQLYMFNLLDALAYIHSKQIVHRDVKPNNFLFNRKLKQFCLIDFGLSQDLSFTSSALDNKGSKSIPNNSHTGRSRIEHCMHSYEYVCDICMSRLKPEAKRSGTSGYRAPEILMKYENQGPEIDVWSVGVILLTLLSGRYPFFKAKDDLNALEQIIQIFGIDAIKTAGSDIGKIVNRSSSNDIYFHINYRNSDCILNNDHKNNGHLIMRNLCKDLRANSCDSEPEPFPSPKMQSCPLLCCASIDIFRLLARLLTPSAINRPSAKDLLLDKFFS